MNNTYIALINVPSEMLYVKEYDTFVQFHAELIMWHNDEPKYQCEIDRLNMLRASNIKWDKFCELLDQHITETFKARKDAN